MNKLKIEIDVSMYDSIHMLKDLSVMDIIVDEVNRILEKQKDKKQVLAQ